MRFEIDIDYAPEKMEANRKRMKAYADFRISGRMPVGFCIVPRFFTPVFGMQYKDLFSSVDEHFYLQLQFLKYRIENIPEDMICQGPVLTIGPYFDNVLDSDAFGAETVWPENETLHALPTINSIDGMAAMEMPEINSGLWGKYADWWIKMKELITKTKLTFNGREGGIELSRLGIGGLSPHMIAVDLVGIDFYLWQIEYPELCKAFLKKIAMGLLRAEQYFRTVDPRPRSTFSLAEDTAQVLSPEMFAEFCVPVDDLLFNEIGKGLKDGRGIHMCGDSTHLLRALKDDLKITSFNIFGYKVSPKAAAENLGGNARLWGNINPMLLLTGTKEEVKDAARECVRALGPHGGFMLGDGANVCPGTPLENLAALTEAADEYAAGCL
jgi:hypothetical protein